MLLRGFVRSCAPALVRQPLVRPGRLPSCWARSMLTHAPLLPAPADHFAIIELSGTQYKVTPDCVLCTQKLVAPVGSTLTLDRVLLVGSQSKTVIGSPHIAGATVDIRIEEHNLLDKVVVFKKKRRKGYRRWRGHRQPVTIVRVLGINAAQLHG
jgi:large subunit ribosomal protein L21